MSVRTKIAGLIVLSVLQLGAASWSIAKYETTLASGTLYKIRTEPIDPADAFRGRYVAVQPAVTVQKPMGGDTERLLEALQYDGSTAYVKLTTDAEGFAAAAEIVTEPPDQDDYLKIERVWQTWRQRPDKPGESEVSGYSLRFSFDRYYMNEAAAPLAQSRYFDATRRNADTRAWLTVRVKNGLGVIDGLFVDGVPIEEVVRR